MRLPPRSRLSRTEGRAGCPARPRHAALEQVCASPRPPWSSAGLKSWPGPSRGVLSCRLPWWPSGSDSGLPPQGVGWIPGQGSATPQALHSQEKATLKSTDMPGPPGGASGLPCRRRRDRFVPGSGRSPGGGHGDPLQCSCLESPVDTGAGSMGSQRVGHDCSDLAHISLLALIFHFINIHLLMNNSNLFSVLKV